MTGGPVPLRPDLVALRVDDFRTHVHAVSMDADALARLAPHVVAIAEAEGLPAHARSVLVRGES